jgi:hypothetical protein
MKGKIRSEAPKPIHKIKKENLSNSIQLSVLSFLYKQFQIPVEITWDCIIPYNGRIRKAFFSLCLFC